MPVCSRESSPSPEKLSKATGGSLLIGETLETVLDFLALLSREEGVEYGSK
jgi:hypothetical protein